MAVVIITLRDSDAGGVIVHVDAGPDPDRCAPCNGKGQLNALGKPCPLCHGTGRSVTAAQALGQIAVDAMAGVAGPADPFIPIAGMPIGDPRAAPPDDPDAGADPFDPRR